mmetsp:Transcript_107899/g.302175  ORF Transcript_107899/g.302175 Transcript_107899/m.302175 type:complete len:229 (+) Transcript_107899:973-1659(+)
MGVVTHDQWDAHHAGIENGRKDHKTRAGDVNEIGLELFNHLGTFHIGKVQSQGYLVVKRKGESLSVANPKSKGLLGELIGWRFTIHCQDIHFISSLLHEFEHFVESIGVSRNVRERSRLDHKTNSPRRISLQWRGLVAAAASTTPTQLQSQSAATSSMCSRHWRDRPMMRQLQGMAGRHQQRQSSRKCWSLHYSWCGLHDFNRAVDNRSSSNSVSSTKNYILKIDGCE